MVDVWVGAMEIGGMMNDQLEIKFELLTEIVS